MESKFPSAREIVAAPIGTVLRSDAGHLYVRYSDHYWMAVFLNDVDKFTPNTSGEIDSASIAFMLTSTGLEQLT